MSYTPSNIVQYNEYYPFGMQTNSSWTRDNNKNNFKYNEASELNTTSGWYDLAYRNYDATLGRFFQVDPLATVDHSTSPFAYAGNNPVLYNDPLGLYKSINVYGYTDAQIRAMYRNDRDWGGYSGSFANWAEDNLDFGGGGEGGGGRTVVGTDGRAYGVNKEGEFGTFKVIEHGYYTLSSADGGKTWTNNGYTFDHYEVKFEAVKQRGPSILIELYDKPTGWNQEEYSKGLRERLIANGFSKDIQITFSQLSHFEAFLSGRPTATITIKRAYLSRDPYDAGGYATPFSEQSYVYKGLTLGTDEQANVYYDMWMYVNASMHELGHSLFGFDDYKTTDGGPTKGIMDYVEVYNGPLVNFTYEQRGVIKASKWGN